MEHTVLGRLIGANYVGPVSEVLAVEPGRQKLVLDIGTGTGQWYSILKVYFRHRTYFLLNPGC